MWSKIKSILIGAFMIALLLALIALILWRIRSLPFYAIAPMQAENIVFLEGTSNELDLSASSADPRTYQLKAGSMADTNSENILSILEGTSFRPDLRNLLPHGASAAAFGKNDIASSVTLKFQYEQEGVGCFWVTFHGENVVSLSVDDTNGFKVYHPSNHAVAKQLAEYIKKTGVEIAYMKKDEIRTLETE